MQAPDDSALQIVNTLKQVAEDHPMIEIGEKMHLEPYVSQNFMGFFIAEDAAAELKRLAMQFVKEISNTGERFSDKYLF